MQSGEYLVVFGSFSGPRALAGAASSVLANCNGNCHAKEESSFLLEIRGLAGEQHPKCEHVYTNRDANVALQTRPDATGSQ
jgi:hypothetical protein